jgi:hypothetical protein
VKIPAGTVPPAVAKGCAAGRESGEIAGRARSVVKSTTKQATSIETTPTSSPMRVPIVGARGMGAVEADAGIAPEPESAWGTISADVPVTALAGGAGGSTGGASLKTAPQVGQ